MKLKFNQSQKHQWLWKVTLFKVDLPFWRKVLPRKTVNLSRIFFSFFFQLLYKISNQTLFSINSSRSSKCCNNSDRGDQHVNFGHQLFLVLFSSFFYAPIFAKNFTIFFFRKLFFMIFRPNHQVYIYIHKSVYWFRLKHFQRLK